MEENVHVLNHDLAQQIYQEEEIRIARSDITNMAVIQQDEMELHGDPLSYKQCQALCPNHYVGNTLFRVSGHAKATAPLKLSDLRHTILARHLLSRFIQVHRCPPNNNQVAIYFVQQCYCYYVLQNRVDWNDRPGTTGVGGGRLAERVHAQEANADPPPRKRGFTYLPEETDVIEQMASQGMDMASQGETPASLRARNIELERKVQWYEAHYGPIPKGAMDLGDWEMPSGSNSSTFGLSDMIRNLQGDLQDQPPPEDLN